MAKRGSTGAAASARGEEKLLSERLLVVLTREMEALEMVSKELKPMRPPAAEKGDEAPAPGMVSAAAKGRIEMVGQMTRTLEKLLELKRLEALAARGDEDDDGEAARLRDELLKRLRALDARRRGGPTLFLPDGRFAGDAVDASDDGEGAAVAH